LQVSPFHSTDILVAKNQNRGRPIHCSWLKRRLSVQQWNTAACHMANTLVPVMHYTQGQI